MNSKAFTLHCWRYLPLCILLLPISLFSQTISFTNPSNLSVCDSSTFSINILNEEDQPLVDGQLTLEFPDCMQYSSGSILGASELDISDLSQPVFTITDLAVDAALSISLTQIASCACIDAINSAEQFNNSVQVDYSNGSAGLTTSLYEVETPLLVITNVTNTYLSGQKGDILQRSFTINNTRFGPLSSFVLTDTYGPGIEVSSSQGTVLEDSPGFFELELNSADFLTIGDGDGLFEFEESITVIEYIKIIDCGIDLDNSISQIEFSWGCFNLICQDEIQTAIVEILPTEDQPDLSFEPYTTVPYCFCGPEGHLHGLTITNNGESAAFDINIDLRRTTDGEGMDINSFIVDSIGSMQPIPAIGLSEEGFDADCVAPQPVYRTATFTLEELGPGESVFVHWQVYFCQKGCNSPISFWEYKYEFYRECPPDLATVQEEYISVLKTDEPLITSVSIDPDCGFLFDDTFCNYQYSVSQDTLDVASGYLAIDFVFPCGFTWLDPAPTLAGVLPDVFEVNANTGQTTVYMEYPLPLPQDSAGFSFQLFFDCDLLCDTVPLVFDSLVTSCIDYEACNPLPPPNIFFDMVTTLQICEPFGNVCAHQSCQTIYQPFECEAQDTNYIGSSGYYFYRNNAKRVNFGLADNDNDQFPDPVGMLDLSAIELQRFIPGDTILSTINGIVVADETGATFNQAVFDLFFNPVGVSPEINEGLFSLQGFEFLEAELQVFDFSSSTYYNCPITETTISFSNASSIHHVFDIEFDDFNCGIPANFELAHADSLLLKVYTRIGVNPIQEDPNSSVPPLIQISHTSTSQIFSDNVGTTSLNCGCDTDLLELSGYEYQIANGVFVVPPCDTSQYLGANFLNFSLAAPDLFPFEYRWGALFDNLELQLSDGFELVESQVSRVQWQSGVPLIVDKPVSPELINSLWHFQLDTCQVPPLDEGFSILTQHRLTRDCHLDGAYELITYTDIMFAELLPEDENPRMLSDTSNSLRALNPDLNLTSPLLLNTSSDNKFRWELDLINNINSVASQMSGVAYNVWLSPESLNGLVSDFILEDVDNDVEVPLVNGLFQLGDLDPEINRNFRLIGLNSGCGLDSVLVHFGWNCEELQSLDDDPCFQRELLLEGLSPDGEIDFQVFSPTDTCITLCDTVPYHTIEIFNADLGAICALELTAYIPSGFQVLPGSCELSYPLGAAFAPIPDPQDLGNGQYLWDFDTFSDSLLYNCLPGVPLAPSNSLQLRFLGMTDCDFPINSTILFVAEGLQTCQDFANAVLRESEPVCIETNAPDGQAFFNASLKEEVVCEEEAILEVALIMDVESILGDTIEVVLPPGILYVPGSYNPLINPPAGPPNITFYGTSQVLRFGVPANVPAANVVSFEVAVSGFLEEDCGNLIAIFRATRLTDALCAASGETCSVAYELGNGFLEIPIQRPEFSIESFTISATPSGGDLLVTYQVEVVNLGPSFTQNLILQFLDDIDGTGTPTGADALLFTQLEIDFPGTGILTGSFIVPLESLCNLMVWIDPEQHCVCSSDFSLSTAPIQLFPQPDAVICSNEILEIGWCEGDFETLWEDATLLNCTDCCPANFQYENLGQVAESFELIQLLSLGECEVEAIFNVTVLPEPGILFADTMICMGDTATLIATGPGVYDWTGPGIINPTLQGQLVSPAMSSWYILSVEDINGCPNVDSVFVEVLMLPTVDVSSDTVICSGAPLQLETVFDPGWTFEWTPASLLDDPFAWNPNFIGTTDTTLYLLVSNILGCSVTDSVEITFAEDPELIAPADQILCLGLSDTLIVSGADNYLWEPAVDCLDPDCASVSINPTEDITYQVVGMNASGCSDTAFVFIDVLDGSLINESEVNICAGEVIDILGVPTSVAGVYCDTLVLAGGCLEITCVELFVNPEEQVGFAEVICPGDSLSLGGGVYYQPGDYFLSLQTWQGCDSLIDLNLSWYPLPELTISPEEINLFNGQSAILEIFGGGPGYTYNWSNPDQLSCSDCPNPTTIPLGDDVEFVVEVTDENGCVQILSVRVDIISDCDGLSEQIPNAFSPNDDNVNDVFRIPGEGIFTGGVELEIWNRWGQLVLRDDSGAPFWDGTQNGEAAPQDTYVYRFFVECSDGEMLEIYGEVQLLR